MSARALAPAIDEGLSAMAEAKSLERRREHMRALGWHRDEIAKFQACGYVRDDALPADFPGAGFWAGQRLIQVDGRAIRLQALMRNPWLAVLSGVMSEEECDALIELARPRLKRSEIINTGDRAGSAITSYTRTSQSTFISTRESDLVARLECRVAALLGWPVHHLEHIQIVHYGAGADFVPHHDYFDLDVVSSETLVQRGGHRIGSLLLYLNTPSHGGSTMFSDVELDILPRRGSALYFAYPVPDPSSMTLHSGAPVLQGEKWLATFFVRQSEMHRRPELSEKPALADAQPHE